MPGMGESRWRAAGKNNSRVISVLNPRPKQERCCTRQSNAAWPGGQGFEQESKSFWGIKIRGACGKITDCEV